MLKHLNYRREALSLSRFFKKFELHHLQTGFYLPPSYVLWDSTRRCNLNCRHCGASKEHYDTELSTAQVQDFISQVASIGTSTFAVTGGEPLLRSDLIPILSHAHSLGLATGIASNGFLLNREKAFELKVAGVSSIQLSLDGDETTHNHIRRNDLSYQKVIQAIAHCREAGIPRLTISTVATDENIHILPALKDILLDNGIAHWKIIPLMPIGRAEKTQLLQSKSLLHTLLTFITAHRTDLHISTGENLPYLGEYELLVRDHPTFCPVGFSACCLGVDGRIRGCPEMPDTLDFCEGSILHQSFDEIWQKGFFKYRQALLKKEELQCRSCNLWLKCRGGCWVMRLAKAHCIKELLDE